MRRKDALFGALGVLAALVWAVVLLRAWPALTPPSGRTSASAPPARPADAQRLPGRIAFAQRGEIYLVRDGRANPLVTGGGRRDPALTQDGGRVAFALAGSVDGKSRYEGQVVPGHLAYSSIVSRGVAGGVEDVLVNGLQRRDPNGFHQVEFELQPAWSPDAARLAFVSDDGDGVDLQVLTLATRRFVSLTRGSLVADPAWSPDGRTIAVSSYTTGRGAVTLLAVEGNAQPQRLRVGREGDAYRPSFSPDGGWLLLTLRTDRGNDLLAHELQGGRLIELTRDGRSWGGVFSPDGERIAFLRDDDGTPSLYVMELGEALRGGAARPPARVATGVDGASRPSWSR